MLLLIKIINLEFNIYNMKNLKNFQSFNEGKGRIELIDNFVVAGDVNLPQT